NLPFFDIDINDLLSFGIDDGYESFINTETNDIETSEYIYNAEANNIETSEYIYSTEYNDKKVVPDNDKLDSENNHEFTYSLDKHQTF
ncbi:32990_t:CDS:1, partial [Racocetra persica]